MAVQYTIPQGLIAYPVEASNAWNDMNHGLSSYRLSSCMLKLAKMKNLCSHNLTCNGSMDVHTSFLPHIYIEKMYA